MDESLKKQLKLQYKETKPQMGVYALGFRTLGHCYIGTSRDIPSTLNRHRFTLGFGQHRCKRLQEDWAEHSDAYETRVLEVLEYRDGATPKDYADDLELMLEEWKEKLGKVELL